MTNFTLRLNTTCEAFQTKKISSLSYSAQVDIGPQ